MPSSRGVLPLRRFAHDLLCALGLRDDKGSWILPDQLLACAYPRSESALAALAVAQIRLLVNLHVRAHAREALARHGLTELHLPTRDFAAPSLDALRHGVASVQDALERGERVAVHCGGGRGRTGTLIACVLVARGEEPAGAIAHARSLRRGAVETREQEEAVAAFSRSLMRA